MLKRRERERSGEEVPAKVPVSPRRWRGGEESPREKPVDEGEA